MRIIGYGEDSLTLSILNQKMKVFLGMFDDNTDLNCVTFLYRPSFGRGSHGFGEFDAIIATDQNIYLIESKWQKSTEIKKSKKAIELTKPQAKRHLVFKEIYELYDETNRILSTQAEQIYGWSIPKSESTLLQNICFVLDRLKRVKPPPPIKNILLLFTPVNSNQNYDDYNIVAKYEGINVDFDLIVLEYSPLVDQGMEGFFEMFAVK